MAVNQSRRPIRAGMLENPVLWCRYLIKAGYITVVIMLSAHTVWFFAARRILAFPPQVYLRNYILLPFFGLFAVNIAADLLVRAKRAALILKEYAVLVLFLIFSYYLCWTHQIASVLLGSYLLPVFASTIFSNIKMTRRIFWASNLALLSSGAKQYLASGHNSRILMDIFVAWDMLLCSYILARALIRYGQENRVTLLHSYRQQEWMEEQLKLDLFTGLYNKATFDDCLPKWVEECNRQNVLLSLAIFDLDHFKQVNDAYGHMVGDHVLQRFAHILRSNRTDGIQAFRIGGEEFSILFKGYSVEDAFQICDGMRAILEASFLPDIDRKKITFSCGLTCIDRQNSTPEKLLKAADSALYEAKKTGRNRVVRFQSSE